MQSIPYRAPHTYNFRSLFYLYSCRNIPLSREFSLGHTAAAASSKKALKAGLASIIEQIKTYCPPGSTAYLFPLLDLNTLNINAFSLDFNKQLDLIQSEKQLGSTNSFHDSI